MVHGVNIPAAKGPKVDWSKTEGVDPAVAAELDEFGISSVDQLEDMSAEDRSAFESKLKSKGLGWNWGGLSKLKTAAAATAAAVGAKLVHGVNIPAAKGPKVDWSKTEGVDPAVAAELDEFGISSVDQLEDMSAEDRSDFESKLKSKGLGWDWGGLSKLKTAAAATTAAVGAKLVHGVNVPAAKGPKVDWSKTEGVDPAVAAELDELGISSVDQLENMSDEDRRVFESRLASKGLSWDWGRLKNWKASAAKDDGSALNFVASGGENKPRGWAGPTHAKDDSSMSALDDAAQTSQGWAEPTYARIDPPSSVPSPVGFAQLDNVSPELADELSAFGISNVDQLDQLSADERQRLDSHLAEKGHKWDWGWLTNWKSAGGAVAGTGAAVAAAGTVAATQSNNEAEAKTLNLPASTGTKVDWTKVDGMDPALAAEMQTLGIESVDQLENLSDHDRQALESRLSAKGLSWDWGWLGNWKTAAVASAGFGAAKITGFAGASETGSLSRADSSNTDSPATQGQTGSGKDSLLGGTTRSLSDVTGQDVSHNPNQIPRFAEGVPKIKDDLTLLDGIDGPQAIELHKMGIHNFDQLHELSAENRMRLQNWFRQRGWFLDMDQWRIASEGNTLNPTIEDIQQKAYEIYLHREEHNNTGGERTDWEQSEWELRGNPIFGYGVPHDVEDFAVSVTGITPEARDELYRMGLYNSWQVQGLDHDARRLLTRWFAGPRFGVDLTMAFGWLSSLQSVPQDKNYGHIFANRPSDIDDLSDIKGVGHATERDLNRIGIYQFGQIASWTDENIDAISETLELGDRVREDKWVVQAQQMSGQS